MSNPNSPTLDEVIENVMEEVLRERVEEGIQETTIEVVHEEIEVVVEEGEARLSTPTREQKRSKNTRQRRVLWKKGDSRSSCRCLKRRLSDEAGKS